MAQDPSTPFVDPDEITDDEFTADLKKETEQDINPNPAPPPPPEPPPVQPGSTTPPPQPTPGATKASTDDEEEKILVDMMQDSEFMAWVTVETANIGNTFLCQAISQEWDPAKFEANKANLKKLERITGHIFERYKLKISPWFGLAAVTAITFGGPISSAVKIRKEKIKAKKTGMPAGEKVPERPGARPAGRPSKEWLIKEKEYELWELKQAADKK